jgi:hypothetical protein
MANTPSLKRLQIDKANSTMVLAEAVAAFLIIFALTSSKTLYTQLQYQSRVVSAKESSLTQLKADVAANKQLVSSYKTFVNTKQNLIGGNPSGTAQNGGDNGKIVLDALPSQYDYPALTTSVQYFLNLSGLNIDSIGGTDEEASLSSNGALSATATAPVTASGATPATVPGTAAAMPFEFSADGPYSNILNLFSNFQKSIRPFSFQTISITGDQSDLTLSATAQSYYQPQDNFTITTETIR